MAWTRGDQRNPAEPEAGYYALKLVKKGPEVAAQIIREVDYDATRWHVIINGEVHLPSIDPELNDQVQQVWLFGRKIDDSEYRFLLHRYKHAKDNTPDHPFANPLKPIDDLARRLMGPLED
jgi:hypothetical protein